MVRVQKAQACRFLLRKHGLLGKSPFRGEEGVLDYVQQTGCVQYDPVDVCGRSHELALLARVRGFTRTMLNSLLYEKRQLMDYFDKNMCIMLTQDWPNFAFVRESFRRNTRSAEAVDAVAEQVLSLVHEKGCLSAQELGMKEKTDWSWSDTTLGRAALETLYFRGELVVHHKTGTIKSYALAADCLPQELLEQPAPFANEHERRMWQVLRRIGAVGLLWNAPGDAWLGVDGLNAQARQDVFADLERLGVITAVAVEGITRPLYCQSEDLPLLHECLQPFSGEKKAHMLPPLDCMLWDRKLVAALFDFTYKWEIYTPEEQRRYGYYVLPVLYGERFAGRVEPVCDRKAGVLRVKRFWPEEGVRLSDRFLWALEDEMDRLRAYHGLTSICWEDGWVQQR